MPVLYQLGTALAKICFTAFARLEVEGREAVPPIGGLIVVANHVSNADPPMLVSSIPRRLHFLGKNSLFANPLVSYVFNSLGVHPLKREGANVNALRWNLKILRQDQPVVVFPEGTRSRGGGMIRGKPGIAYLAAKSQTPILPIGITGTENIRGFWRIAFPLCRIKVRIGDPFTLPVLEGKLSRPVLENLTDMIMYRIAALLPHEYRGYYATEEAADRR